MPKRIRRRRTRGWEMPAGAVYVGRPTIFGNPWKVTAARELFSEAGAPEVVVAEYRAWLTRPDMDSAAAKFPLYAKLLPQRAAILAALPTLRGKDLACWCPLVDAAGNRAPCHADVLLELANTDGGRA